MTAKVILNPYAGRWKALNRLSEVETVLQEAHIEYELTITESPGPVSYTHLTLPTSDLV